MINKLDCNPNGSLFQADENDGNDETETKRMAIPLSNQDKGGYGQNDKSKEYRCGEALQQQILRCDDLETEEKACQRTYHLFIPCTNLSIQEDDTLPLVVAFHCLGCTSHTMMFWTDLAEKFQFVLAIPVGVRHSFNAQHCCGYALEHKVDDLGYVQDLLDDLQRLPLPEHFPKISKTAVYAMGWSNGGYMSVYASHMFRAIAPVSGFQVDLENMSVMKPTGLFMHHAKDDPLVRIGGCCADPNSLTCCCKLSEYIQGNCTSAYDKFQEWSREINHCDTGDDPSYSHAVVNIHGDAQNEIRCITQLGCKANTTFCEHQHGKHFNHQSFQRAFPMMDHIALFFARDACSMAGGNYNDIETTCMCPSNTTYKGTYCLPPPSLDPTSTTGTARGKANVMTYAFVIAIAAFIGYVCYKRKLRGGESNKQPTQFSSTFEMQRFL